MTKPEEAFLNEVTANAQAARAFGVNPTRFLQNIEKHGAVKTVREQIRRRRVSDGFDRLQAAGRLDLSVEASVIKKPYAGLFTDEEADYCLDVLMECGFFGYR